MVILAGGRAQRLSSAGCDVYKPALPLPDGSTLLYRLASAASRRGWQTVIATDSRNRDAVDRELAGLADLVDVVEDRTPGTGSALISAALHSSGTRLLLCNSDTLLPANPFRWAESVSERAPVTALLLPKSVQNQGQVGTIGDVGAESPVALWAESTQTQQMASGECPRSFFSSSGVYSIDRSWVLSVAHEMAGEYLSLEQHVLPLAVRHSSLSAVPVSSALPVYDFGTPGRFRQLHRNAHLYWRLLSASGLGDVGVPAASQRIAS